MHARAITFLAAGALSLLVASNATAAGKMAIATAVSTETKISYLIVAKSLNATLDTITKALRKGSRISMKKFGYFMTGVKGKKSNLGDKDLVKRMAKVARIDGKQAQIIYKAILHQIAVALKKDRKADFGSFGVFTVKLKAKRTVRVRGSGKTRVIPAKAVVMFAPGSDLKNTIGAWLAFRSDEKLGKLVQ